jgi:hypothetical protein
MSGPLKIDTHIHLYSSGEEGEWWKRGYAILGENAARILRLPI